MNDLVAQNYQVIACDIDSALKETFDIDRQSVQLNEKEQLAVTVNFKSGLYDIAAEIIWRRTIAVLRDRLNRFGDDFVGDMLGYNRAISVDTISEKDVIELNYEVGFLRSNEKMELIHYSEQIALYTSREYQMVEKIEFDKNHATSLISDCLKFVLSDMTDCSGISITDIRKKIRTEKLLPDSEFVQNLKNNSRYFEKRTILRSLMNMAKTDKEEEKQIVFENMRTIVPAIWDGLAEKDKYNFGTVYAEISNTDRKDYINAVKTVLINVHGFDYVPENLKSNSFINTARNLINIHNAMNNFYNEPLAAKTLASMGTMIPDPAVYDCINATLICATGNGYGVSDDAIPYLEKILDSMTLQKWELYLKDLSLNVDMLYQLAFVYNSEKRWASIINKRKLSDMNFKDEWVKNFLIKTSQEEYASLKRVAFERYNEITNR